MSDQEGNRDNPYSFDDYLLVRNQFDYYADDEFFQALVKNFVPASEAERIDSELRELSKTVSFRHRDLAEEANRIENHVRCTQVRHYDAHNHRIDEIKRCSETEILERDIFDLGLFDSTRNTAWSRFCKMFLLYQNGEMGVMCPIACTHGMVELMQKYEDPSDPDTLGPEAREVLAQVRDGQGGEYKVGAQFVSEIQGGSDVPANLVEAVFEENEGQDGYSNVWRLYGQKFFCSAMQADYAVVTAKPKGVASATKVAAFAVPSWLPGNKEKGIRNSYTIDRLKPKLGTAELPTAEVTYNGAVAYPVGPLEKGLANVVGVVLTISRLHVAFGMASAALRVAREAQLYADFRDAFGVNVSAFPLMKNQIDDLNAYAWRSAAGAFKLYGEYIALGEELAAGIRELERMDGLEERKRRFRLREMVMFQKIVVADDAPAMTRLAMSFFGGHGVMEDFLPLPRFLRDSLIMELWEGPRSVLLTQIHRDFQRVRAWYKPEEFVADILTGAEPGLITELGERFALIISYPTLLKADAETLQICRDWQELSNALYHAYQDQALTEMHYGGKHVQFRRLVRKFRKRVKTAKPGEKSIVLEA